MYHRMIWNNVADHPDPVAFCATHVRGRELYAPSSAASRRFRSLGHPTYEIVSPAALPVGDARRFGIDEACRARRCDVDLVAKHLL